MSEEALEGLMDALQTLILAAFDARELSLVAKCMNTYDGTRAATRALDVCNRRLCDCTGALALAFAHIKDFSASKDVGNNEVVSKEAS